MGDIDKFLAESSQAEDQRQDEMRRRRHRRFSQQDGSVHPHAPVCPVSANHELCCPSEGTTRLGARTHLRRCNPPSGTSPCTRPDPTAMAETRAASQRWCCPGSQGTSFGVSGDRLSMFDDDDTGTSDNGPVFIEDWTRWADGERQEVPAGRGDGEEDDRQGDGRRH